MKQDEIIINEGGVAIFDTRIGLTPNIHDFELAFAGDDLRSNKAPNGQREMKISDSKGLFWLVDLKSGAVLCVNINLSNASNRGKIREADTTGCFAGKIRVGEYTVKGAFSLETAEIIRKLRFPGLSLDLIPERTRIRALLIGFKENERLLKAPFSK